MTAFISSVQLLKGSGILFRIIFKGVIRICLRMIAITQVID
jgi:hypothetical protein